MAPGSPTRNALMPTKDEKNATMFIKCTLLSEFWLRTTQPHIYSLLLIHLLSLLSLSIFPTCLIPSNRQHSDPTSGLLPKFPLLIEYPPCTLQGEYSKYSLNPPRATFICPSKVQSSLFTLPKPTVP